MNWVAVEDRLPPHGEVVLAWSPWDAATAILVDRTWYRAEEGVVMTREVYERCGRGCCGEWKDEDVEVWQTPTHWCEIIEPVLE